MQRCTDGVLQLKAAIALIAVSWSPQRNAGTRPVLRKGTERSLILLLQEHQSGAAARSTAAEATSLAVSLMNFGCVHLPCTSGRTLDETSAAMCETDSYRLQIHWCM